MKVSDAERNKGRKEFVLLVLVFFVPIIIVLVLYFNLDKWEIGGGRNHGDLIEPARKLQDVTLETLQGEKFVFSNVRDKWLMIEFGKPACDEQCKQKLYLMRQIRLAQGGNRIRIERIYISTGGAPEESFRDLLEKEHPEMLVVYGDDAAIGKVIDQFRHDVGKGSVLQAMYLVDPRGFLMMSYPEGYEPKGAIQDFERLLKYARSG